MNDIIKISLRKFLILAMVGEKRDEFGKAFNVELKGNEAFLEGILSRKKQVIPKLESVLG